MGRDDVKVNGGDHTIQQIVIFSSAPLVDVQRKHLVFMLMVKKNLSFPEGPTYAVSSDSVVLLPWPDWPYFETHIAHETKETVETSGSPFIDSQIMEMLHRFSSHITHNDLDSFMVCWCDQSFTVTTTVDTWK